MTVWEVRAADDEGAHGRYAADSDAGAQRRAAAEAVLTQAGIDERIS